MLLLPSRTLVLLSLTWNSFRNAKRSSASFRKFAVWVCAAGVHRSSATLCCCSRNFECCRCISSCGSYCVAHVGVSSSRPKSTITQQETVFLLERSRILTGRWQAIRPCPPFDPKQLRRRETSRGHVLEQLRVRCFLDCSKLLTSI